jgi:hypothetical protein
MERILKVNCNNLQLGGEREGVILTYIDATQGWIATSGINEGTDALSPEPYSVDFLVIAGGAGGGSRMAGGGGAGGYRASTQTATPGTVITVTVGDGGAGGATTVVQELEELEMELAVQILLFQVQV